MWTTEILNKRYLPIELLRVQNWLGLVSEDCGGFFGYGFCDDTSDVILAALNKDANVSQEDLEGGDAPFYSLDLTKKNSNDFATLMMNEHEPFDILYKDEEPCGFLVRGDATSERLLDVLNAKS